MQDRHKLWDRMYGNYSDKPGGSCHHSDHYDSKQSAKQAAKRMGISGCHSMQCGGKKVYMPGRSHEKYMDAMDSPSFMPGGSSGSDIPGL